MRCGEAYLVWFDGPTDRPILASVALSMGRCRAAGHLLRRFAVSPQRAAGRSIRLLRALPSEGAGGGPQSTGSTSGGRYLS